MKARSQKKTSALRRQAYQIALQLPEDANDAGIILAAAREIHMWIIGAGPLPRERRGG